MNVDTSTNPDTDPPTDSETSTDAPLRLLVLCAGDPEGERTFSGSARSLISALERQGCVHHKANVTAGFRDAFSPGNRFVRTVRRLDRLDWEGRYRWTRLACELNSMRARRIAAGRPGFDACLMYGTNYNPRLDVPTYCYFDATVAQVARAGQWSFRRFSEKSRERAVAYQAEVFRRCRGIFPRTRWAAESVEQDYGIPPERITVAGAGSNHTVEPLPHGPYDRQTILFIGTDWERKGGPLIVRAFRRLRRTRPEARLVIVGCNPDLREPGIEVVGRIRKDAPGGLDRLLRLYSEASVFCIMSNYEPFGIVVVEAQNAGVPCVVPARFAFTETVVDGVTGRHLKEDDPELLARILEELLSDPARLETMGEAARRFATSNYTWDIAARRIIDRILRDREEDRARA